MGRYINGLAWSFLERHAEWMGRSQPNRLRSMMGGYLAKLPFDNNWKHHAQTAFMVAYDDTFSFGASYFDVALNTAMIAGSDAVRLCARLHSQCEIHAWVNGPNRAWLADLIDAALEVGLFRDGMGWSGVSTMLRSSSKEPVVTSYSVTEEFPNRFVAGLQSDDESEDDILDAQWRELSDEQRWDAAIAKLLEQGQALELKPDDWQSYRFGAGQSVFDIARMIENPVDAPQS